MSKSADERDEHSEFILKEATEFFDSTDSPILLSELGTRFSYKWGTNFRQKYGMSMREFVEYYLEDKIVVGNYPGLKQKIFAIPEDKYDEFKKNLGETTEDILTNGKSQTIGDTNPLIKFPRAFLFSFQRELAADKKRFIRKNQPIKYTDATEVPLTDDEWVELEQKFIQIQPALKTAGQLKEEDRQLYRRKIDEWLTSHDLEASTFFFQPTGFRGRLREEHDTQILRDLIEAQPPELQDNLVIPASLIKKLLGM